MTTVPYNSKYTIYRFTVTFIETSHIQETFNFTICPIYTTLCNNKKIPKLLIHKLGLQQMIKNKWFPGKISPKVDLFLATSQQW